MTDNVSRNVSLGRGQAAFRCAMAAFALAFSWQVHADVPNLNGIWRITNGGGSFIPNGEKITAPLKGEYATVYAERRAAAARGTPIGDPTASCLPQGMPRFMNAIMPLEITQTPDRIVIYAEWNMQVRRIYLDGRSFPPADELDPTFNGYSIGRWEKDELVVETRGLRGDTTFDGSGLPHSDALVVHERLKLVDPETLHNVMTVEDSKAFTHPWTVTKIYKRAPTFTIIEYVCMENNRNPIGEDGVTGFIHPGE